MSMQHIGGSEIDQYDEFFTCAVSADLHRKPLSCIFSVPCLHVQLIQTRTAQTETHFVLKGSAICGSDFKTSEYVIRVNKLRVCHHIFGYR